jgi:hypothetical protein
MSLFQSVIWPAVAGNVAWAIFTVAVLEFGENPRSFYFERLALLVTVTAYLFLDWTNTEKIKSNLKRYYWVADAPLASAIAALAIAAQARTGEGWWFLVAVFVVAGSGQIANAWVKSDSDRGWNKRRWWIGLYVVASALAIFGGTTPWGWHLVLAAGVVVIVWALARFTRMKIADGFRD